MNWIGLAFLFLVLLGLVFWFFGRRPIKHSVSQESLEDFLEVLLKRGFDGGFAVIRHEPSAVFIQFAKSIENGAASLTLDLPVAPWSQRFSGQFRRLVREEGLELSAEPTPAGEVVEFIDVDFGEDVAHAASFARRVFREVFGLEEDESLEVVFKGVSARDEMIGG